jgi:hypothetical protein
LKTLKTHKALIIGIAILVFFLVFKIINLFTQNSYYTAIETMAIHYNGKGFAGSSQCLECHKDIYISHLETAHFMSSAIANKDHIKGSFELVNNYFSLNDSIYFVMTKKHDGYYQETYSKKNGLFDSKRLDITIGSGTKGQTYLNWQNDSLFQLQVSYFTKTDSWANSPDYEFEYRKQQRPIESRCLECHTTFAKNKESILELDSNTYDRSQIIYGIDCERCHGPALKHVNFHRENPEIKIPSHVTQYKDLSKQQRLDACALCHSGTASKSFNTPFEFDIGDRFNQYPVNNLTEKDAKDLDVHGNQYTLMSSSDCFKVSGTMDCSTCHDVHSKERGNTPVFNNRCLNCHSSSDTTNCSLENSNNMGNTDCIKCHMPLIASKSMFISTHKDSLTNNVKVRSHFIGIYKDAATKE